MRSTVIAERPAHGPGSARRGAPALLEHRTLRLIQSLPIELPMLHVRRDFPHVLNRLATVWHDPRAFNAAMRSLLVDERGTRQGFPFAVIDELIDLRRHYFLYVQPEAGRVFDRDPVTPGR